MAPVGEANAVPAGSCEPVEIGKEMTCVVPVPAAVGAGVLCQIGCVMDAMPRPLFHDREGVARNCLGRRDDAALRVRRQKAYLVNMDARLKRLARDGQIVVNAGKREPERGAERALQNTAADRVHRIGEIYAAHKRTNFLRVEDCSRRYEVPHLAPPPTLPRRAALEPCDIDDGAIAAQWQIQPARFVANA